MKLELGNKTYEFEFTINAVCDLEEMTGKGFADLMSVEGLTSIRALMWCGLVSNQKTITLAQTGELLQEYLKSKSIEDLIKTIGDAFEQAGFIQAAARKRPRAVK